MSNQSSMTPSCDTWVALKDATRDGSVILAKNSDRPPMEAQPLVQAPRCEYEPGAMVKCTHIEIPQSSVTYAHIGSKIWWTFGYEHGMNEHGVAIGNEAVWSKEPREEGVGLLGMDLIRLGLERGKSAYEAMHVMIELLQRYGQEGESEWPGEWGGARNDNSYIIADPNEAWVLETAGRYWVAKHLSQGVYSISNVYSIETEWDEAHPELVQHAIAEGWTRTPASFNFARDYGDYWRSGSNDPGMMQVRRNATLQCLRRDVGNVSVDVMMRICRDHHEGTLLDPQWGAAESFWAMPCMHDSPKAPFHTAASMVAHLRGELQPLLRQVYFASFSNPCTNVFQPFYLHGPNVPAGYAVGTSKYSLDSPWWDANRVKLLCHLNFRALQPKVREIWGQIELAQAQRQRMAESQAQELLKAGNEPAAALVLQLFVNENAKRVAQGYEQLNELLPRTLAEEGIRYLHSAYLKEWTSKAGVPLPLQ